MMKLRPNQLTMPHLLYTGVLLIAVLSLTIVATPHSNSYAAEAEPGVLNLDDMPLAFIANEGQLDPEVAFHIHGIDGSLFFTPSAVTFSLPMTTETAYVFRLNFVGADDATVSGFNKQVGVVNFLTGNDSSQWQREVSTYAGVTYHDLYPGIDLRFEGKTGVLKGTYTVAPGVSPSLIRWDYTNADHTVIDPATGDLRIVLYDDPELGTRTVLESSPIAWQNINGEQVAVDATYAINDAGQIAFELGTYDAEQALIIDPEIQYSTYIGGYQDDIGYDVVVDGAGNAYLTGVTEAINFPHSDDAVQPSIKGTDAFVSKLNVSIPSKKLVYSTFLGGIATDEAHGIDIDADGNAYVTGWTNSNNFPGTPPLTYNALQDAFIAKLNANGSAIVYARYLGGNGDDVGEAVAVDASGNAYVTGWTESTNFPTNNAIQASNGGGRDAFITKYTVDGTGRLYSSYLGGTGADEAKNLTVDASNQVYIAGYTESANYPVFPVTPAPLQSAFGGGTSDGFLSKLTVGGSAFEYSTFLGGNGNDSVMGITVGASGNVFLTGWTSSTSATFPISATPLQAENAGLEDAFIIEVGATGDTLVYGTFLGGGSSDKGADLTIDPQGVVHLTGNTQSSDFPLADAFVGQSLYNGGTSDAFVSAVDLDTNSFFYSSYVGGNSEDNALAISMDVSGGVFITGYTNSSDFPVVKGAFQRGGNTDMFLFKIGSAQSDLTISKTSNVSEVLLGDPVTYTIVVTNLGPDATEGVAVEDNVPPEITVATMSTTQGICSQVDDLITCTIGAMEVSDTVTITIEATGTAQGLAINTAEITQSSQFDPNTPNEATAEVLVFKDVDLAVDKTADAYRVSPGQTVEYTIEVINYGPAPANNVMLTEMLPTDLVDLITDSATAGTFDPATGIWSIGTMARDATATLTVTVRVKDTLEVGTVITNYVTDLNSGEVDPTPENNVDSVELVVISEYFPAYGCMPSAEDPDVIICVNGTSD